MNRTRLLIALAVVLVLAGLLYYYYGGRTTPSGQSLLVTLTPNNFEELRDSFNQARGTVRVIALLSPT
jgi:cytochrome b561